MAQLDPATSWRLFQESLRPELNPANQASSREGVHLGAMAGTTDVIQRRYLGLCFEPDGIRLEPAVPDALGRIRFVFQYRGGTFELKNGSSGISLRAASGNRFPVMVLHAEDTKWLTPGDKWHSERRLLAPV